MKKILLISLVFGLTNCETTESQAKNSNLEDYVVGGKHTDKNVVITAAPLIYRLDFTLENKTANPISLIWDECAVIDEKGKSHSVFGEGIKLTDAAKAKPPTMVHSASKIENSFISTNVQFETNASASLGLLNNGYYPISDYWYAQALFDGPNKGQDAFERSIKVVFALDIGGKKKYITIPIKFGRRLKSASSPGKK